MEWISGHVYSVKLFGIAEPQGLIYRFDASSGGRLLPEVPMVRVFTNDDGDEVQYRGDDITSVVQIKINVDTDVVVDLTDASVVEKSPSNETTKTCS